MFRKFLSKLGVGSAKVNLVLQNPQVRLGEEIVGGFFIEGGSVEQQINKLDVDLRLSVNINSQVHTETVATIPVSSSFVIQPREKKTLSFSYRLPIELPVSREGITYTFVTRLDIAGGVDTLDHDVIQVLAPFPLEKIFYAFNKLGFREKASSGKLTKYGQQFSLFPTEQLKEAIQEVEVISFIEREGIRLYLEVDVYAGFPSLKEKELKKEVFFSNEDLANPEILTAKLLAAIRDIIEHPQLYAGASPHFSTLPHHSGHELRGTVGGLAAGMFAGLLVGELIEDAFEATEDAFGLGEETGGIFDLFEDGE